MKSTDKFSTNGYFTVEAACVYPFVIAVILLVIYVWFFLYDRCLMEQDCAGIMVKGAVLQGVSVSERIDYMKGLISENYNKQYLCWEDGERTVGYDNGMIEISTQGSLEFPFMGLSFWSDDGRWEASRTLSCKEYDRIFIIRTYRKIQSMIN